MIQKAKSWYDNDNAMNCYGTLKGHEEECNM